MSSPLPPDPYDALGVSKDATATAIKTAHRKLVLKCHPDKVTDPAEKEAASNKFHQIQSAYEILIDDGRRERYDAQVRLAEMKKEALARRSEERARGADVRPTYKSSHSTQEPPFRSPYGRSSERVVPQTEERRPSYATDYFDSQLRATPRKEAEYAERTPRRAAPSSREKEKSRGFFSRSSKDNDREKRKEKTRVADRETRRERERKYPLPGNSNDSGSDLDDYERRPRRTREEDDEHRVRESSFPQDYRMQREPDYGHYGDRTRKMYSQDADARDYIMSAFSRASPRVRPETDQRRPSPMRMVSARDARVEYVRRGDGRPPVMVRSRSDRPVKEKEPTRKTSSRTPERTSSTEHVEERRPPPLNTSKSSPADIRLPTVEKQRSASLQPESDAMPIHAFKRSDTMPTKSNAPKCSRATEFMDGQPTPATTPENQDTSPSRHGHGQKHSVESEAAAPDGYRTEMREPFGKDKDRPRFTRKVTRSPSPIKQSREAPRETTRDVPTRCRDSTRDVPREAREMRDPRANMQRAASSFQEKPQPSRLNTRTTSYVYGGPERGMMDRDARPLAREPSPREGHLYGEIRPPTESPRSRHTPYPSFDENSRYSKPFRDDEVKMASGYPPRQRPGVTRPGISRSGSYHPVYV